MYWNRLIRFAIIVVNYLYEMHLVDKGYISNKEHDFNVIFILRTLIMIHIKFLHFLFLWIFKIRVHIAVIARPIRPVPDQNNDLEVFFLNLYFWRGEYVFQWFRLHKRRASFVPLRNGWSRVCNMYCDYLWEWKSRAYFIGLNFQAHTIF